MLSLKLRKYRLFTSFAPQNARTVLFWPLMSKVNFVHGDGVVFLKINRKETKVALACLGLTSWRIFAWLENYYRVCVPTVLQEKHLIRNWGLIASKYKLVSLKKIDKKI